VFSLLLVFQLRLTNFSLSPFANIPAHLNISFFSPVPLSFVFFIHQSSSGFQFLAFGTLQFIEGSFSTPLTLL